MVHIDSTSFGEICIDGKTHYADVVVWWDGRIEHVPKDHIFGFDDFFSLAHRKPEAIVIGTGQSGSVKIPEKVMETAESLTIPIYSERSPKALEIFNGFIKDGKKAVALIHVNE
jgi:hypothetical protein